MLNYLFDTLSQVGLPEDLLELYLSDVTQIKNKYVKLELDIDRIQG